MVRKLIREGGIPGFKAKADVLAEVVFFCRWTWLAHLTWIKEE